MHELLDDLGVPEHGLTRDLARRRRFRAADHELDVAQALPLQGSIVQARDSWQLAQLVDKAVDVDHAAPPAASCRCCSSSVATDDKSTRSPT